MDRQKSRDTTETRSERLEKAIDDLVRKGKMWKKNEEETERFTIQLSRCTSISRMSR